MSQYTDYLLMQSAGDQTPADLDIDFSSHAQTKLLSESDLNSEGTKNKMLFIDSCANKFQAAFNCFPGLFSNTNEQKLTHSHFFVCLHVVIKVMTNVQDHI